MLIMGVGKDSFNAILGRTVKLIPKSDILLVMGDLNAEVGIDQIYQSTIGNNSLQ